MYVISKAQCCVGLEFIAKTLHGEWSMGTLSKLSQIEMTTVEDLRYANLALGFCHFTPYSCLKSEIRHFDKVKNKVV